MNGSLGLLYFGLLCFNIAVVVWFINFCNFPQYATGDVIYFLLIMPLMLLSGLLTPIQNMPHVLQIATYANPLRFGIDLVQRFIWKEQL
ncbi:ABC transporter permease [Acinetobacter sp. FDAARGOS_515]|uniref:ABC transporter permease n=1 Tax=Acinetobacter sp. FDAARGOS_515 TaxID=2420307 RepID=UPI00148D7E6B|nr:ABC transporter permease [Acinetobacter sp. FDAARGOS_515]